MLCKPREETIGAEEELEEPEDLSGRDPRARKETIGLIEVDFTQERQVSELDNKSNPGNSQTK